MLQINHRISIPLTEFTLTFARSSGPGGQNVNKVNSKVTLHWDVTHSPSLPDDVRARLLERFPTRITTAGELVVSSQSSRDQATNIADCHEKVRELVLAACFVPKKRRPTKPTKGSRERRLQAKRVQSDRKRNRQQPPD